jgi:hypothetical protein
MVRSIRIRIPLRYFRENCGAPFIVVLMLLLMVAAASLSMGMADVANEAAIYAYYALVVGVVLQLISFVGHRKEAEEEK